jgi:hypothetical protein
MASYGYYDDAPTRERTTRYVREERRGGGGDRDRRYEREEYLGVHPSSRDLVPRGRENSDLSVEEIQRDFPPPGYARDIRRARSAGPYDDYDDRRSYYDDDRDYDRRSKKGSSSLYYESEEKKRARVLGKQEQIIAAITGAALAIGGKELYDRREAKKEGHEVHRNVLATAALGAAGGFAAYQGTEFYNKRQEKEKKSTMIVHKGRDGKVASYYSDDEDDPKEKKGHKNFLEGALAAAGLGGAVKALTGGSGHDDRRSDTRSRGGSRSRSPKGKGEGANKIQKAAMASLIAGATEAFRVSKEPGGWKGEKAKRILTAAAGAATIDASLDKSGSKLGLAESVIGGLVGNRVINGSKKNIEEDRRTGRSRSRSRARSEGGGGGSGLAALATAGLGAFGAKKLYDSHKEKERSRSRSRRRSVDSYDSRDESPDRRRQRSRSRSVVDKARNSLARLGIGNEVVDDEDRPRDRSRRRGGYDDDDEPRGSRRNRNYDSDDDDYYRSKGRGGGKDRDYDDDRSTRGGRDGSRSRGGDRRRGSSKGSGSDSDLGDSDEDAKRAKKMRGKQLITTGLAAVATIHAAHNVYQSMEKRNARHKAVKEGRLSPEEAKKLKSKALLQDAASVGIAALGIKGAISELKEANEMRHEMKEWKEQREERHRKRLERQKRLKSGNHDDRDDRNHDGRRADSWSPTASQRGGRYDEGPRYTDGNPYSAALPAPPVGYSDRRY